jgi:hypothetical protein
MTIFQTVATGVMVYLDGRHVFDCVHADPATGRVQVLKRDKSGHVMHDGNRPVLETLRGIVTLSGCVSFTTREVPVSFREKGAFAAVGKWVNMERLSGKGSRTTPACSSVGAA